VRFEHADAYRLPYPGASFDAVFAHTLLEHLREPERALAELVRVLKPGGVIGLRDCDWQSGIFAPEDAAVGRAAELYARLWRHNGGDPHCGRTVRRRLLEAGCVRVATSASFRWDGRWWARPYGHRTPRSGRPASRRHQRPSPTTLKLSRTGGKQLTSWRRPSYNRLEGLRTRVLRAPGLPPALLRGSSGESRGNMPRSKK
jgi:SAM-dependent methyltransferase